MPCSVHFNCLPVFIPSFTCHLICGKSKTNLKTVALCQKVVMRILQMVCILFLYYCCCFFYIIITIKWKYPLQWANSLLCDSWNETENVLCCHCSKSCYVYGKYNNDNLYLSSKCWKHATRSKKWTFFTLAMWTMLCCK